MSEPVSEPDTSDRMGMLVQEMAAVSSGNPDEVRKIGSEIVRLVADTLVNLRQDNPRFREPDCTLLPAFKSDCGRRDANRFLCACFLEYRSGKTDVWDNVAFFTEEILDDPMNIWQVIMDHTYDGWKDRFFDYNLHPMPEIHNRLYIIANRMVRFYTGDGRQIWDEYTHDPESVYKRLLILQVPRSTACLVVGILKDRGYIQGPFDIVGDIVDSRVLGRMICGDGSAISSVQVRRLARIMAPADPWILDLPLYLIGSVWCGPGPKCRACPVQRSCVSAVSDKRDIRPDPLFRDIFFGKKTEQRTLRRWQDTV